MHAAEGARARVVSLIRQSRSPTLWHAGKAFQSALMALRRIWWLAQRKRTIERYLESHEVRKLELGSGQIASEGWLNTDINPQFRRAGPPVLFLDATRPFPFQDSTFTASRHIVSNSFTTSLFRISPCRSHPIRTGSSLSPTPKRSISPNPASARIPARLIEQELMIPFPHGCI
jgi:hypothetical protein